MAPFSVIFSAIFSAALFQNAMASPFCAYKYQGKPECVVKCNGGWTLSTGVRGADRWGAVVGSLASAMNSVAEDYIAQACGSSVSSVVPKITSVLVSQPTGGPATIINAAPLPSSSTPALSSAISSQSRSQTTVVSSTQSISPSSPLAVTTTANIARPITTTTRPSIKPSTTSSSRLTPNTTPVATPTPTKAPVVTPTPTPKPTPDQDTPANGGSGSTSDINAYLQAHNSVRRNHGAADLTWSDELAAAAQKWANNCKFQHSGGAVGPFGENLSAGTSLSIAAAVKMWTDEVSDYDPSNPQFSHFTQVVWKATTQVGCAVQTCTGIFGNTPAEFYVCEYNPAGNVSGRFAANVQV